MNKTTCKEENYSSSIIVKQKKITKEIPSDIVFEVLTLLIPTNNNNYNNNNNALLKALNRFKCVSKSWYSLICHQFMKEFLKSHHNWDCDGIFINFLPSYDPIFGTSDSMKGILYSPMHGGMDEVFSHRLRLPIFGYKDITPIINGFACLYRGHHASLFNISTRDRMELPSSSLIWKGRLTSVWYTLGFHPVDNVYKLLKVSSIANRLIYEILTLETSSSSTWRWREIIQERLPRFSYVSIQSYFMNGIIYMYKTIQYNFRDKREEYLLAFDIHQENFTYVNLPPCTNIRFKLSYTIFGQFEGRLAVIRVQKSICGKVLEEYWTLQDDQISWRSMRHMHHLPSAEILFCGLQALDGRDNNSSIFIYDFINQLMAKLPGSILLTGQLFSTHITCFKQKIIPLENLVGFV